MVHSLRYVLNALHGVAAAKWAECCGEGWTYVVMLLWCPKSKCVDNELEVVVEVNHQLKRNPAASVDELWNVYCLQW